jgi:hypothetical protein
MVDLTRRQFLLGTGGAITGGLGIAAGADKITDGELDGEFSDSREEKVSELLQKRTNQFDPEAENYSDSSGNESSIEDALEPEVEFQFATRTPPSDNETPESVIDVKYETSVGLDAYDVGGEDEWNQSQFRQDGYAEVFTDVMSEAIAEAQEQYDKFLDTPEDLDGVDRMTVKIQSTNPESENYAVWANVEGEDIASTEPENYSVSDFMDDVKLIDGDKQMGKAYDGVNQTA